MTLLGRARRTWVDNGRGGTGDAMDISKQAAHKIGQDALHSLREKLEARGFAGLDSKGFLKSKSKRQPPTPG